MRTGTAHIKTGVDTAQHSESGGILNMKMCPEIYTWVGTLHIATSGESAYYSVSGRDTAHEIMFKCSYWGGDTAQNSKTEDWGAVWLTGSLSDYSANTGSILQAETCELPS